MSKRKPPLDEKALEFFRRTGRKGGKRSLETMTKAERIARAHKASLASGGRPRVLDWDKVRKLCAAGKSLAEVAAAVQCSVSAVSKIMARTRKGAGRITQRSPRSD